MDGKKRIPQYTPEQIKRFRYMGEYNGRRAGAMNRKMMVMLTPQIEEYLAIMAGMSKCSKASLIRKAVHRDMRDHPEVTEMMESTAEMRALGIPLDWMDKESDGTKKSGKKGDKA